MLSPYLMLNHVFVSLPYFRSPMISVFSFYLFMVRKLDINVTLRHNKINRSKNCINNLHILYKYDLVSMLGLQRYYSHAHSYCLHFILKLKRYYSHAYNTFHFEVEAHTVRYVQRRTRTARRTGFEPENAGTLPLLWPARMYSSS
jgi:hypothetical protein